MTKIGELKKDAKVRLSGSYFKLLLIYFMYEVILFTFSALSNFITSNIIKLIYLILLLVFTVPLSYGLISSFMDIVRGKKTSITEFINVGFKNILSVWKVYLRIFLKLIIPILIIIVSTFGLFLSIAESTLNNTVPFYFILTALAFTISVIILFVAYLYYSLSLYILKDEPEKTAKEIVELSHDLMKGNIIKYIGLSISFIGWYLLITIISLLIMYLLPSKIATLVMEFCFIALFPYITATMIGFYEDVLYDKKNEKEKQEV